MRGIVGETLGYGDAGVAKIDPLKFSYHIIRAEKGDQPFEVVHLVTQRYYLIRGDDQVGEFELPWDGDLWELVLRSRDPNCDEATIQRLGDLLREALAPAGWAADAVAIATAADRGRRVHITFRLGAAELFELPWEWMTLGASGRRLVQLRTVLLRYTWPGHEVVPEVPACRTEPGRIVFAWSTAGGALSPTDHTEVLTGLAAAAGHPFDATRDQLMNVSVAGIDAALKTAPIRVLHLLAHGKRDGSNYSAALDIDGREFDLVNPARLRELLEAYRGSVRLVVLWTCFGSAAGDPGNHLGGLAQTIHRAGIATVIAPRAPLSTRGALTLTRKLYGALLLTPASIEEAFLDAREALMKGEDGNTRGRFDAAHLQLYVDGDVDDSRPLSIRPYRGFERFEREHARFFFGREAETRTALDQLTELRIKQVPRLLVVLGASGVGKSSLALAGLAPRLVAADPAAQLVVLRGSDAGILATLTAARGGGRIVIVDQLEEIFTHTANLDDAAKILQALWEVARESQCVATLRIDVLNFAGAVHVDPARRLRLEDLAFNSPHVLHLKHLSRERLREAIERPALKAGLELDGGLADLLTGAADEDQGVLPLVEFALDELWRGRSGRRLAAEGEAQRVADIWQAHISKLLAEMSPIVRERANTMVARLANRSDLARGLYRRRRTVDSLRPIKPDASTAFDRARTLLIASRLLVLERDTLEVAHEAVLRHWPGLPAYFRSEAERLQLLDRLDRWVDEWKEYGTLLTAERLQAYQRRTALLANDVTPDMVELIRVSRAALRAGGIWRIVNRALAPVMVTLVGLFAVQQWWAIEEEAENRKKSEQSDAARILAGIGHDGVSVQDEYEQWVDLAQKSITTRVRVLMAALADPESFPRASERVAQLAHGLTGDSVLRYVVTPIVAGPRASAAQIRFAWTLARNVHATPGERAALADALVAAIDRELALFKADPRRTDFDGGVHADELALLIEQAGEMRRALPAAARRRVALAVARCLPRSATEAMVGKAIEALIAYHDDIPGAVFARLAYDHMEAEGSASVGLLQIPEIEASVMTLCGEDYPSPVCSRALGYEHDMSDAGRRRFGAARVAKLATIDDCDRVETLAAPLLGHGMEFSTEDRDVLHTVLLGCLAPRSDDDPELQSRLIELWTRMSGLNQVHQRQLAREVLRMANSRTDARGLVMLSDLDALPVDAPEWAEARAALVRRPLGADTYEIFGALAPRWSPEVVEDAQAALIARWGETNAPPLTFSRELTEWLAQLTPANTRAAAAALLRRLPPNKRDRITSGVVDLLPDLQLERLEPDQIRVMTGVARSLLASIARYPQVTPFGFYRWFAGLAARNDPRTATAMTHELVRHLVALDERCPLAAIEQLQKQLSAWVSPPDALAVDALMRRRFAGDPPAWDWFTLGSAWTTAFSLPPWPAGGWLLGLEEVMIKRTREASPDEQDVIEEIADLEGQDPADNSGAIAEWINEEASRSIGARLEAEPAWSRDEVRVVTEWLTRRILDQRHNDLLPALADVKLKGLAVDHDPSVAVYLLRLYDPLPLPLPLPLRGDSQVDEADEMGKPMLSAQQVRALVPDSEHMRARGPVIVGIVDDDPEQAALFLPLVADRLTPTQAGALARWISDRYDTSNIYSARQSERYSALQGSLRERLGQADLQFLAEAELRRVRAHMSEPDKELAPILASAKRLDLAAVRPLVPHLRGEWARSTSALLAQVHDRLEPAARRILADDVAANLRLVPYEHLEAVVGLWIAIEAAIPDRPLRVRVRKYLELLALPWIVDESVIGGARTQLRVGLAKALERELPAPLRLVADRVVPVWNELPEAPSSAPTQETTP